MPIPLIRPADVPLDNRELRGILVNLIGKEYESVVGHDIAGGREMARRLDRGMPEELRSLRLAEGLATAIFLYSFSGAQRQERGTTAARLRLSVIAPGIPSAAVGDTLHKLEENLHYLHKRDGRYYFSTELNLVRAVTEAEENVEEDAVIEEIRRFLAKKVGKELGIVDHTLWPKAPEEVPDRRDGYAIVVLSPDYPKDQEKTREFVQTIFSRAGTTFRTYPGGLLVLIPDREGLLALQKKARRLLALREVERTRLGELSKEDQEKLRKDKQNAEAMVAEEIPRVWRYLALWRGQGEPELIGLEPYARAGLTLASLVVEYLKNIDRYAEEIPPSRLLELVPMGEGRQYREIWESFLRTPGMPILPERAVRNAVKEGVRQGLIALDAEGEIIINQDVPDAYLDEALVIPASKVPQKQPETRPEQVPPAKAEPSKAETTFHVPKKKTTYQLRAKVPWEKFSDIFRGVIRPLREKTDELELVIEIKAKSSAGLPENVLEHMVRETLRQINAQILEEREE